MAQKKENRGGARPGSGRKPYNMSQDQLNALLKDVSAVAKRLKSTPGKELGKLIFREPDRRFTFQNKIMAIKLYYDLTVIKHSHQSVEGEIQHKGPVILPAIEWNHASNEEERLLLEASRLEKEEELKRSRH